MTKLSREEVAKIELGSTAVSPRLAKIIVLSFLLFIGLYTLVQLIFGPALQWPGSAKAFETRLENDSFCRKLLLPPVQQFLSRYLRCGNEKVIINSKGQLFYSADVDYLANPGFLKPEIQKKRQLKGFTANPIPAIVDFNRQLAQRNIKLILLPMPVKPMLYANAQNPDYQNFIEQLKQQNITVYDAQDDLLTLQKNGIEPFLRTDTHLSPSGVQCVAENVAAMITVDSEPNADFSVFRQNIRNYGDIAAMLKLSDLSRIIAPETVGISQVLYNGSPLLPSRNAPILLLGDSFTNIYSAGNLNWGTHAGLAEHLAMAIGQPIDVIARNDAGSHATRELLTAELRRGRDRLADKSVVIWQFAVRELSSGDWPLLDLTVGTAAEVEFLEPMPDEPQLCEGTILAVSALPQPGQSAYADQLITIHLSDLNTVGGNEAVIQLVAMRHNKLQPSANLRPGERIKVKIFNYADQTEYASWSASTLTDDDLLLAPVNFAELIK